MMKISKESKTCKIKGNRITSIIDIDFNDKYKIYIFQGNLSENDIIIKYSENGKRIRTPKHIHWTVDLLLKLQADNILTKSYINEMIKEWQSCQSLKNNDECTLTTLVNNYVEITDIEKYQELTKYGEYDIEFLTVLMTLLMTQEKTNRKDAYMFGNILVSLLKDDLDIYSIMSVAGFGGKH